MSSSYDKFQKRRLISSYFSVVLSVFLVLFLVGILGLFVLNSKKLSDDFKEQIAMTVFFKEEAHDTILKNFAAELKNAKYVKSSVFVSKEDAAKVHTEIIGEDFMTFLGANPLQNSFDIHLKADYIDSSNIRKIENKLRENPMISDIVYDKQLVNLVNDNIKKVSFWILIISGFLTLVAVLLINSSMRLSIHSNRFIIKTMQMVGATKAFIRKPFIWILSIPRQREMGIAWPMHWGQRWSMGTLCAARFFVLYPLKISIGCRIYRLGAGLPCAWHGPLNMFPPIGSAPS